MYEGILLWNAIMKEVILFYEQLGNTYTKDICR
jgi:hypothetical protein